MAFLRRLFAFALVTIMVYEFIAHPILIPNCDFRPFQTLPRACIISLCPRNKPNTNDLMQSRASLTKFAWLSIGAAVATIALKTVAYFLTGSVGVAVRRHRVAGQPGGRPHGADHADHRGAPRRTGSRRRAQQGGIFRQRDEGILIFGAAIGIIIAAVQRLNPAARTGTVGVGLGGLGCRFDSSTSSWRAFC